jgi:hypothetical protein
VQCTIVYIGTCGARSVGIRVVTKWNRINKDNKEDALSIYCLFIALTHPTPSSPHQLQQNQNQNSKPVAANGIRPTTRVHVECRVPFAATAMARRVEIQASPVGGTSPIRLLLWFDSCGR